MKIKIYSIKDRPMRT